MRIHPGAMSCIVLAVLSVAAGPRPAGRPRPDSGGADVYAQNCTACHMDDGSGVAGSAPALKGSAVAAGDPATLAQVLLRGPAAVLPANRKPFDSEMPTFETLSDDELAAVMNHVRGTFGRGARVRPITPAQVKAWRK